MAELEGEESESDQKARKARRGPATRYEGGNSANQEAHAASLQMGTPGLEIPSHLSLVKPCK